MKTKDFEVLITPTDVIGQELESVLGGSSGNRCTKCKDTTMSCNVDGVKPDPGSRECPPGFILVGEDCIQID